MSDRRVIKCDCCYVRGWPAIMWCYEVVPFDVTLPDGTTQHDEGLWAFCEECHRLAGRQDVVGMVERSLRMDPYLPASVTRISLKEVRAWKQDLFRQLLAARRLSTPFQGHPDDRLPIDGQHIVPK